MQICVGVTISSIFTSLLEPAYKATITDLLRPEQYSRASGHGPTGRFGEISDFPGAGRISPWNRGYPLSVAFRYGYLFRDSGDDSGGTQRNRSRVSGGRISFLPEIKEGWKALTGRTGMPALVFMGALITFCLGMIQTLASPWCSALQTVHPLGHL